MPKKLRFLKGCQSVCYKCSFVCCCDNVKIFISLCINLLATRKVFCVFVLKGVNMLQMFVKKELILKLFVSFQFMH